MIRCHYKETVLHWPSLQATGCIMPWTVWNISSETCCLEDYQSAPSLTDWEMLQRVLTPLYFQITHTLSVQSWNRKWEMHSPSLPESTVTFHYVKLTGQNRTGHHNRGCNKIRGQYLKESSRGIHPIQFTPRTTQILCSPH